MKHIPTLFRVKHKLEAWYDDTNLKVIVSDFEPAETRIEDGKTYKYPAVFHVKFENQSNWFYSFRVRDGRFVREGASLNGRGLTAAEVYRQQAREARERRALLNPKPTNVLQFKGCAK